MKQKHKKYTQTNSVQVTCHKPDGEICYFLPDLWLPFQRQNFTIGKYNLYCLVTRITCV